MMNSVTKTPNAISWFRDAAPYINVHRGKVFVIAFSGETIEHENFIQLVHDFALLNSLGIQLILVHGARPQIDRRLAKENIATKIVNELRITDRESLPAVLDAVGSTRLQVEAMLTMGLGSSPLISERVDVVSGNYVTAKPFGIKNGTDFELTGRVRSIDTKAIANNLANHQIVLLGSIGYSTTGEVFNLLAEQVAVKTAIAINADKLIFIGNQFTHEALQNKRDFVANSILNQLTSEQSDADIPVELRRHLIGGAKACLANVNRAHIVSFLDENSLLNELFTRDGSGTLISLDPFEEIQPASIQDVVGLIELLHPLEEKGILVKRSREKLEQEIDHFFVTKIDGAIVGCAALYPLTDGKKTMAEVACVAVHPDYRNDKRGEKMLNFLEEKSKKEGFEALVVLTTQTAHWFIEQGFKEADITDLPLTKQKLYNHQRNSKIYTKNIY